MIKKFGPIYIDFDDYPPYSDRISENFGTNFNENMQCDRGYDYSSVKKKIVRIYEWGKMGNDENLFPWGKANKKIPKIHLILIMCICSKRKRWKYLFPTRWWTYLFTIIFSWKPIVNVENIEERLKEMNLHRAQKKGDKLLSQ